MILRHANVNPSHTDGLMPLPFENLQILHEGSLFCVKTPFFLPVRAQAHLYCQENYMSGNVETFTGTFLNVRGAVTPVSLWVLRLLSF